MDAALFRIEELNDFPVCIRENKHTKANPFPLHYHDCLELIFIISGSGNLLLGGKNYSIEKNTLLILSGKDIHKITDSPTQLLRLYSVYFKKEAWRKEEEVLVSFIERLPNEAKIISISSSFTLNEIPSLLRQMLYEYGLDNEDSTLAVKLCLSEILLNIKRYYREKNSRGLQISSSSQKKVMNILPFLERNYYERLTPQSVAQVIPIGVRQFSRIFKSVTGKTFVEYINSIRIKEAKKLLLDRKEIASVCFEVGFEEISYFYRVFKKEVGLTPKQFIESS